MRVILSDEDYCALLELLQSSDDAEAKRLHEVIVAQYRAKIEALQAKFIKQFGLSE